MPEAQEKSGSRWSWLARLNPLAQGLGPAGRLLRLAALMLLAYALSCPPIMIYEYQRAFPEFFDPAPQPAAEGQTQAAPARGVVFTGALITMSQRMLESWLPNDLLWPSVLLDNPQNFQLGQLEVIRYSTRVLRDKLSRQRTTDKIDPQADLAFTSFSNSPLAWAFPSAESKYGQGVRALVRYQAGLEAGSSFFHPRSDNLIELLEQLTSLLGGVDTRLANAPRDWTQRLTEETAGDSLTQGEREAKVRVPWTQIDDNFYFARGVAYALREVLAAVRYDFSDILKLKHGDEFLDSIIAELGLADFEPLIVLNGARGSLLANHSLSLMATLEDARQKLVNLQHMLER